jgi:hypothetical protein
MAPPMQAPPQQMMMGQAPQMPNAPHMNQWAPLINPV